MPANGIISIDGQSAAASAQRETRLIEQVKRLKEHCNSLSFATLSYRKQHDAGYESFNCTCVNCVWVNQLLQTSAELIKP